MRKQQSLSICTQVNVATSICWRSKEKWSRWWKGEARLEIAPIYGVQKNLPFSLAESEWIRQANKYGNYQNRLDDLYIRWRIPDGASCQGNRCVATKRQHQEYQRLSRKLTWGLNWFTSRWGIGRFSSRDFSITRALRMAPPDWFIEWNKCLMWEADVFLLLLLWY